MQVVIQGLFKNSGTERERQAFLRELQICLKGFNLPVLQISSQRPTGGDVILEVPETLELHEITRSLASFAEILARQNRRDVYFSITIPSYDFAVDIGGAA